MYIQVSTHSSTQITLVLVDPRLRVAGPFVDTLREPEGDLALGILDGVRAVADVSSNINCEVAADSARGRVGGSRGTKHDTASLDGTHTLPNHAANRAGGHVIDQSAEEALG